MTFAWHCRECNSRGEGAIALNSIDALLKEADNSLLKALCLFVKRTYHKGCDGEIGVRAL